MVSERGYDAVSIRDVAEEMGISKGTIIHHYGSKEKILEQVHSEYMKRRLREAYAIIGRLADPREQLSGMVLQNLFAMHYDREATVAFAREIVRFASDSVMDNVRTMRDEYFNLLRGILERGMESGAFRREDPAMIALQIFGMINWSWTWLRAEGRWSLDELGQSYVRLILTGIDSSADALPSAVPEHIIEAVQSATSKPLTTTPA
jgi:TetR/AcrR family transcriptional regulator, cholesterol catabolism regulator